MAIALRGENVRKKRVFFRIINVVVSMVVFLTLVPQFSETIGKTGVSLVAFVAGLVLLLDTVLPLFFGPDSPERYEDYAKYIMGYHDFLDETLVDATLTPEIKHARLTETIALAQLNLRDVRSKWPEIVKDALKEN